MKKYLPSLQTIAKVAVSLVALKVVLGFVTPKLPASAQAFVPTL
jgi:hypothetical protein